MKGLADFPIRLDEMQVTLQLLRSIEKEGSAPGLGPGILWGLLVHGAVYLGDAPGLGIAYIRDKSGGKGVTIRALQRLFEPAQTIPGDYFTISWLIAAKAKLGLRENYHQWVVEDLSSSVDKESQLHQTLVVMGRLLWDQEVGKRTADNMKGATGEAVEKLEDEMFRTKGSVLLLATTNMGMDYVKFRSLSTLTGINKPRMVWWGMTTDRVTEFHIHIDRGQAEVISRSIAEGHRPDEKALNNLVRTFWDRIEDQVAKKPVVVPNVEGLVRVYRQVWGSAHTMNRGLTYFREMMRAHAALNGRDKVTSTDVGIFALFRPNLMTHELSSDEQVILQHGLSGNRVRSISRRAGMTSSQVFKIALRSRAIYPTLHDDPGDAFVGWNDPFKSCWEWRNGFYQEVVRA